MTWRSSRQLKAKTAMTPNPPLEPPQHELYYNVEWWLLETNKKKQVSCIQMHLEVMRWMSMFKNKQTREVVSSEATKSEEEHEDVLFVNYGKQSLQPGAPSGERTTGQPNNQTTRQLNNQITKQPDNHSTGQPDNQATRQPENETTRQPKNQTTGQPDIRTTE